MMRRSTGLGLLLLSLLIAGNAGAREFEGHAIVRSDGSLLIKSRVVHLFGIYMPSTNRQCRAWITPVRCDERGVLALDFFVKGFITCFERVQHADGSVDATCYRERSSFDPGTDLAAYLIERGWALARPEASFEYHAMEQIARSQEVGVWGWQVDSITIPRQ